ncbi:hypothetical protein GCM10022228_15650 [Halomonas cibimaris]|uniref:Prepilin-type N-terminal cleavage/methylation domain-containing protein n=2 Tax=Halomonas cibimaris TaxID=657012 RepID=A0ABP7LUU5_9GAMM
MRGFTLVELLVTLAIAAILAALVAPAWSTLLARQRLNADANAAVSALALARSDAIRLHRNVEVEFMPPAVNRAERRPEGCRDGETSLTDVTNEEKERYGYASWCYRLAWQGSNELIRAGQLKYLSKPSKNFSLVFEPLGTANIDDCPTITPDGCRLVFSPPEDISGVNDEKRLVNVTGSVRREAR